MRAMSWVLVAIFMSAGTAAAQNPGQEGDEPLSRSGRAVATTNPISPGAISPTPEMWFYQEAQRLYNDPHYVMRKRAEFRGEQRSRRLAAMKWFGMSNARPTAGLTPWSGGAYSPTWIGNSFDPFVWRGVSYTPVIVVRPNPGTAEVVRGLW